MSESGARDTQTSLLDRRVHPDIRLRLSENPDGIIEKLAESYGVPVFDVAHALPANKARFASSASFEPVMADLTGWGSVRLIVHTKDIVLEVDGSVPAGTQGRGYFNIHGDSPIGGHIRADRCGAIAFITRPFMGRSSASVQFFSVDGDAMFKVFVRRDENGELDIEQLRKFELLRDHVCQ